MKRKYFIYFFTAFSGLVLVGTGCKKFLDVNQNTNSPTPSSVQLSYVLSAAERNISQNLALGTGLGTTMGGYTHQVTSRGGADKYGAGESGWNGLFSAISNLDVIIDRGATEKRFVYVGIAKILKAYTFSMIVDVWGDAPFSEFDKFQTGLTQPKFDKGIDIYPQLFKMLDDGIADLNNTTINPSKPGADDYIYKGSVTNWIKAANTIKLKMYTQVRLVQDVKAQVTALLAAPATLINSQGESFMLPYGPIGATDDRHPAFANYNSAQRDGLLFSPWMYEIMKGRNATILNGIADPRIPYYIYNQKTATGLPENCTEYRDGGFISIVFASTGPCRDGSNSQTYSLLGLYPCGGRYDEGKGVTINSVGAQNSGTGALPHQFLTYADRLYLEAELINAGLAPGTEKTVFSKALDQSFAQMDSIIINYIKPGSAGAAQTVPAIATLPATLTYKTSVLAAYDAGSATKRLEYIMTEKWINRIENPVDNYTDYRRTTFPVLFTPAPQGTVTSVLSPDGKIIPVLLDKKYPLSLPFSTSEISLNSSAPPQKVAENYKVFWMP